MPQQPGALTMGWDAQPEPSASSSSQPATGARMPQQPGALTMGWDVPEEAAVQATSPAQLAAKSVATTHTPAHGVKSPAATLLGLQAPWAQQAAHAEPAQAAPHASPPPSGATAAYVAQQSPAAHAPYAPPQMPAGAPAYAPNQLSPHQAAAPQSTNAAASTSKADPNTTLRTRNDVDDGLDKPPKNMLPIYALVGVVVIAAIVVAIVLATR
jgi:hypothetical protein